VENPHPERLQERLKLDLDETEAVSFQPKVNDRWKGIIIAESLEEPSLISDFEVFRAKISEKDLDLGEGKQGRWHLYYVHPTSSEISAVSSQIKPGWYCHFWRGNNLVVVFRDKKFEMLADDKSTWRDAVEYGRSIGIPEKQLDFPT